MRQNILKLDQAGQPSSWISPELAITYHYKGLVAYQIGDESHTLFRGGQSRMTGEESRIWTAPIIAVKGEAMRDRNRVPTLTNSELFARDRHICAYCGHKFGENRLTRDHIIPVSKGGLDVWTNVVTACERDNHKKDDKTLEAAGMQLLYVPYTPNRAEHLILKGRKILPVQAEYLAQFIPQSSRVHEMLKELHNVH